MSGPVLPTPSAGFEVTVPVVIVGAGACGLIAALAWVMERGQHGQGGAKD